MGNSHSNSCRASSMYKASSQASSQALSDIGGLILVSSSSKDGSVHVSENLREYETDEVTTCKVVKVTIFREEMPDTKGVFHDFVVLELKEVGGNHYTTTIRAEKTYLTPEDVRRLEREDGGADGVQRVGGSIVIRTIDPAKELKKAKVKHTFDLQGCGELLMKHVLEDLKSPKKKYNLWKHNCWKYAYDVFRKLLQRCIEHTNEEKKKKIELFLKNLRKPDLFIYEIHFKLIGIFALQAFLVTPTAVLAVRTFKTARREIFVKGLSGSSLVSSALIKAALKWFGHRGFIGLLKSIKISIVNALMTTLTVKLDVVIVVRLVFSVIVYLVYRLFVIIRRNRCNGVISTTNG